jgi:hypothetical protein
MYKFRMRIQNSVDSRESDIKKNRSTTQPPSPTEIMFSSGGIGPFYANCRRLVGLGLIGTRDLREVKRTICPKSIESGLVQ